MQGAEEVGILGVNAQPDLIQGRLSADRVDDGRDDDTASRFGAYLEEVLEPGSGWE